MSNKKIQACALGALLMAATAACYIPAFRAGFVWDDDSYLTQNETLDSATALSDIWFSPMANAQYYPLVFTSLYIQKKIWGLSPLPFHAANIFLHALCALLLWRVLLRLGLPGAYATAAIFALHPINAESVAWVTERKNVLSGVFFMISSLWLLRYFELPKDVGPGKRGVLYAGALLAFLCALFSKTVTASLPAVFLILLLAKNGRVRRAEMAGLAPFFALGAGLSLVTVWVERMHVGALGPDWDLDATQRVLIAGRALWFYLGKIFWPQNLAFVYERWEIVPSDLSSYIFPAGFILLVLLSWLFRDKLGRAPAAALCVYFVLLFPALGFLNVFPHRYSFVADHFAYLAMIAPVALVAGACASWLSPLLRQGRKVLAACLCLVCALLGTLTFRQARTFLNLETLWTHTLDVNPKAWMAHNNLGVFLAQTDRLDEALYHFLESLRLRGDLADVHYNLAGVYAKKGDEEKAREELRQARAIESLRPLVHFQVGQALEQEGRMAEAARHYQKAIEKDPDHPAAHYALGALLDSWGKERLALYHYVRALMEDPGMGEAHYGIGLILSRHEKWEQAAAHFRKAAETRGENPDVLHNLGVCLAHLGNYDSAEELFRKTLDISPNHLKARENLAFLLSRKGDAAQAIEEFKTVVGLAPDNAEAWYNLGVLYTGTGNPGQARECLLTAVARDPALAPARYALGLSYEGTGDPTKAEEQFRAAVNLDPKNRLAKERLDAVRKQMAEK